MVDLDRTPVTAVDASPGDMRGSSERPRAERPAGVVALLVLGLFVIGLGLVVAPLAFGMFSRAPQGATMLTDFKPFMTSDRLAGFSDHLQVIDDSVTELDADHAERVSPPYATFSRQWPGIDENMAGLMDQVTGNLGNYQAMAAMPSFRLFPWFFAAPGALLATVAAIVLLRRRWTRGSQLVLAAIGLGLIAIPVATGMFSRAPKGAEMMGTFKNIETTANVTRIQGYFSQMAAGQGAIRLDVVPALERSGTAASALPATNRLNSAWVGILNDMPPMIGAMSDNVGHYQAISGLPSFTLFPWFFVAPGLIVLGLVLAVGRPRRLTRPEGPA